MDFYSIIMDNENAPSLTSRETQPENPDENVSLADENEPTYRYIDDDELQKDFMSGIGLSDTNIPGKIYFYFYSIDAGNNVPFLKIYLNSSASPESVDFFHIELNKDDILAAIKNEGERDLNELFLEEIMENLTTNILQDHEISSNYPKYYKGFIQSAENIIIVFELPSKFSANNFSIFTIDEIMNKGTRVSQSVRQFFYNNNNLLYITTPDFENLEIPQLFYGEDTIKRTLGEYGYFFKLREEAFENSVKYVGFVEDKTYYGGDGGGAEDINKEFDACVINSTKNKEWYFKSGDFFYRL